MWQCVFQFRKLVRKLIVVSGKVLILFSGMLILIELIFRKINVFRSELFSICFGPLAAIRIAFFVIVHANANQKWMLFESSAVSWSDIIVKKSMAEIHIAWCGKS